uniref:DUF4781 domain-containing protein n=1 Tax=Panagrellus redivivus TaxID=6233 RepID=A0A7E4VDQ8_PANRE
MPFFKSFYDNYAKPLVDSVSHEYYKETPESWDTPEVKKWKETAEAFLKSIYINYGGGQWDAYATDDDELLKAKICYALFGDPTDKDYNGETLLKGYKEEQQAEAAKIAVKLRNVYKESKVGQFRMFVVFIFCKMDEAEFRVPLFRVGTGEDLMEGKYVDSNLRVYNDWNDWKDNNCLPMMKYAIPVDGYYTCEAGVYEFDANKKPLIEFVFSPACRTTSKAGRTADSVASVTALLSGGVAIASMFTPLAPVVLFGSAVAGGSSAVYGASRSGYRLYDKGTHDESLRDQEALLAMAAITLTPLSFGTSAVNGYLANGARVSGRIFSNSMRTFATLLNCTTFGLQSGMLAMGIFNLYEKKKNDKLTTLDVLQFSMSVFFFTNTLIQPKTATGIINQAQQQHFDEFQSRLTDADAQKAYQKFLNDNNNGQGIAEQSKIVRAINKIDDPNTVFKGLANFDRVDIGGRKGNTLIVGKDGDIPATRINPNKMNFAKQPSNQPRNIPSTLPKGYTDTKINGKPVFKNLNKHQIAKINKALHRGEGFEHNQKVFDAAIDLAGDFKCKNFADVLDLYEVISSKTKGTTNIGTRLNAIRTTNRSEFINDISSDLSKLAETGDNTFAFSTPMKALAHFCKHGDEFGHAASNGVDFYISNIPKTLFRDENLVDVRYNNSQSVKTYLLPDNTYGVLKTGADGKPVIATVFKNEGYAQAYAERMLNQSAAAVRSSTWGEAVSFARDFGRESGFVNWEVNVHNGSQMASLECCGDGNGDPVIVFQALEAIKDVYGYYSQWSGLLTALNS